MFQSPDKDVLQTDRFMRFSTFITVEASKDSSDKEEKMRKSMHRMDTTIAEACQDAEKKNNFPIVDAESSLQSVVEGSKTRESLEICEAQS